jgi:hypothetical protein
MRLWDSCLYRPVRTIVGRFEASKTPAEVKDEHACGKEGRDRPRQIVSNLVEMRLHFCDWKRIYSSTVRPISRMEPPKEVLT